MGSDPEAALAMRHANELATAEASTAAQASQAQALVLAQFGMAARNPRNVEDVRTSLKHECRRPGFAEAAQYRIPFKKWDRELERMVDAPVIGFSIRFAETAARMMRNIAVREMVTYDDDHKRISQVYAIDLESNTTYDVGITVEKTIERKKPPKGRKPIAFRENSYGDTVAVLRATEHEFRAKYQAEVSKAIRTCQLRLIPADILEECKAVVEETMARRDAADPDAAMRKLVDGFAKFGVTASQLEEHLGHSLKGATEGEISSLRWYYVAIRDGECTWKDVVDGPPEEGADPHAELRKKATDALRRTKETSKKAKREREKPSQPEAAAPEAQPPAEQATPPAAPPEEPLQAEVVQDPRTALEIEQGWDWDEATGEKIPPAGWDG